MIRTFQPGDILLLQRLQGQSTKLNAVNSLLAPRPALWTAIASTFLPMLHRGAYVTYVLRQEGTGIDRVGFLQAQRRPGRPEEDLLMLAPALETRSGHPAIWLKLLSHYINETSAQNAAASPGDGVQRIYADVPDQPLLVQTLGQVGFSIYARQTIWRLTEWDRIHQHIYSERRAPAENGSVTQTHMGGFQHARQEHLLPRNLVVRAATKQDEWGLMRLYSLATPRKVQVAEGTGPVSTALHESNTKPPILEWWGGGEVNMLVLEEAGEMRAALRVAVASQGILMQIWADTLRMESSLSAELVGHGLQLVQERLAGYARHLPIYTAVRDYQGGLGPVLAGFGFAPVMDHAKMVKQMVQRAIETESVRKSSVEVLPEAIATFRRTPAYRKHRLKSPAA